MNKTKLAILIFLLTGISFLAINCKHEIPLVVSSGNGTGTGTGTGTGGGTGGGGTSPQTSTCSPDTVYFSNTILPLINSSCATTGCHDAISRRSGLNLTSYNQVMGLVSPGNASGSRLYSVITTTSGENKMPPNAPLTATQIASIQKWINQGALNNQCSSGCDSSVYTYSGAVSKIMSTYCVGCHNSASLGGGIDLSAYASVKTAALGRMMGSINQLAGYSAMPKGGNKLSDCQIAQIQKWIQAGTLNN
jgi:mono/diheme cytochrome c family protein